MKKLTDTESRIMEECEEDSTLKPCEDCGNLFKKEKLRPYKYEPAIKLCDDCHDNRMDEEEE